MLSNLCDVHTHTLASKHAYSTLEENARAAADRGMELLATSDHFSCMTTRGVALDGSGADLRDYQSFLDVAIWPRTWYGVALLRSCEIDIVDSAGHLFGEGVLTERKISGGTYPTCLDLQTRVLRDMDFAIASVHTLTFTQKASRLENTKMYLQVLEHPKVLILGHIARLAIDFELDPVLEAARDLGKLIEINNATLVQYPAATERCKKVAKRCAELGCAISLGTDAHIAYRIGRFDEVFSLLDALDFPQDLIATRTQDAFWQALQAAHIEPAARDPWAFP